MNEKLIEKKLMKGAKLRDGKAVKFTSPAENGWPDRLVIIPHNYLLMALYFWVETKSTGKGLDPLQKFIKKKLIRLNADYFKIDSQADLDAFWKHVDIEINSEFI
jgi:hypothetical protein